jgi:hypothetical protein
LSVTPGGSRLWGGGFGVDHLAVTDPGPSGELTVADVAATTVAVSLPHEPTTGIPVWRLS